MCIEDNKKVKDGKIDSKHYGIRDYCDNCRERILYVIPKGQTVRAFLAAVKRRGVCKTCGCEVNQRQYVHAEKINVVN